MNVFRNCFVATLVTTLGSFSAYSQSATHEATLSPGGTKAGPIQAALTQPDVAASTFEVLDAVNASAYRFFGQQAVRVNQPFSSAIATTVFGGLDPNGDYLILVLEAVNVNITNPGEGLLASVSVDVPGTSLLDNDID
jgi:hypothetical protein